MTPLYNLLCQGCGDLTIKMLIPGQQLGYTAIRVDDDPSSDIVVREMILPVRHLLPGGFYDNERATGD
jgi:hypothetical protein